MLFLLALAAALLLCAAALADTAQDVTASAQITVPQNGGTLAKTRVDGLQPLVPECTSPEEGETLFAGSGRFFCDQQAGGTNITYYSYIITPMNGYEDSYYVLSSLNTENGEAIREDLAPGDSVMLDRQLFGMFLEVHNCRIQLFYGNG